MSAIGKNGSVQQWLQHYLMVALFFVLCFSRVESFSTIQHVRTAVTTGRSSSSATTKLHMALPKDKLLQLAQDYLDNPSLEALADDFIFRGPVIGPLTLTDFKATLESVSSKDQNDIASAFPDLQPNVFGLTADDPIEPNRVWYFVRPRGTFTGPFDHPVVGRIEPTGANYIGPPEARSILFNDDGKVQYQSVGYVTDRFTGDTTGGRGAVFGIYAVMGQEIDASVGSPVTTLLQKLATYLPEGTIPKSYSKRDSLPSWWKDPRMGAEK